MDRLDTIGTQNWMICIKLKTCQVAKLECEQQLQEGLHLLNMLACQIVDRCFHLFPVQGWQSKLSEASLSVLRADRSRTLIQNDPGR